eukprot:m.351597 g.351597  ORF g.351597 m.351597 type:complete len:74 (+) comp16289_c0_seq1:553-774(+)
MSCISLLATRANRLDNTHLASSQTPLSMPHALFEPNLCPFFQLLLLRFSTPYYSQVVTALTQTNTQYKVAGAF